MRFLGLTIKAEKSKKSIPLEQHNASMSIKNNQVRMLELTNEKYMEMIRDLNKQLTVQNKGTLEERALDAAIQIFAPAIQSNSHTPSAVATPPKAITSETNSSPPMSAETEESSGGVDYSQEEIKSKLMQLSPTIIKQLSGLSIEDFRTTLLAQVPDMSEKSLLTTQELVKEMAV